MFKTKIFIVLLLIVMLLSGLTGCANQPSATPNNSTTTAVPPALRNPEGVVSAEGNIVPRAYATMYTRAAGKLADVLVKKGDVVQKDSVLVRFSEREQAQAALAAAKQDELNAQQALDRLNENADVSKAQAQAAVIAANKKLVDVQQVLADLDNQDYQDKLDQYHEDAGVAKKDLDDAQKEWNKYKDLNPDNQKRKDAKKIFDAAQKKYDDAVRIRDLYAYQLDQANNNVDSAKAALASAQRDLEKTKNGPNTNDLALAQSRLESAKAQVSAAKIALDNLDIKAPFNSTVVEIKPSTGDTLMAGAELALVADLSELYVETDNLTEINVVKISVGDKATVTPDALPALSLPATVTDITLNAGKKGGDVVYTVRLKLNQPDPRLRWGMTVVVRFASK